MKKIKNVNVMFLLLVLGLLAASACSKPNTDNLIGQGSDVPQVPAGNTIQPAQNDGFKEFKITAKQFEFVPSTIEVNKGDKVRLIVTSVDVPHGIAIPEYGINQRLEPGKTETIEFTADKVGTFTTYCSVVCGSGHKSMKGQLIVK